MESDRLFIGGRWVAPSGDQKITVASASDEQPLGSVPEGVDADIDRAVEAARTAFDTPGGWADWEPARRAESLMRLADELDARSQEMSARVSSQNGMPISTATAIEGSVPASLLRYYATLVSEAPEKDERVGIPIGTTLVRHQPIGVVAAITPWNYPQALAFTKLAPALAAGCTVVLKPAPETVLDSVLLAEAIAQAGLPEGVVNVVPGGREVGAHLVAHPDVDKVTFTGSTAAGQHIAASCAQSLRPVTLELGGKSAAVILDDADLAGHAEQLFAASLLNNGQTCYACTRILAPRSRYEEVVEFYAAMAHDAKVGDALDTTTQIGPLVNSRQRARVEDYIAQGKSSGARLTTGGGRPPGLDHGWFVEPTIFADVDNASTIAREEIFGPVLSITGYDLEDDAIRIANDSPYGLGGTIWTQDPDRGTELAGRIQTGTIGVNGYLPDITSPYGGMKTSGLGRELGPEGLQSYQRLQSIYHP
ncbi:aldehyde dehydrogenase [Actinopolymorpha pittospori]|uniref:Acyl-CoA reductase-like NAD-dependent aldehyde dehydrogenase n=1 Tax=Actinopolymorpha pittospori TaxID=648752 RepID=A0A927RAF5_9ACTN|nr:aldehyde dehydrogenase [Actinopolymorpha pittospori]MBE1608927.1 acyl-CoA reductase-like NAD-dependent aldehyde dehydrogenase [Actinopolymorpha pittospori]